LAWKTKIKDEVFFLCLGLDCIELQGSTRATWKVKFYVYWPAEQSWSNYRKTL